MLITNSRTCFEKIAGFSSDAYPSNKDAVSRIGKYVLTVENTFLTERAFSTMAMRLSVQVALFPFQVFTVAIHRFGFFPCVTHRCDSAMANASLFSWIFQEGALAGASFFQKENGS